MFRTKDDDQQFHLASDGTYNSVNSSKKIRSQLVAAGSAQRSPPQQQSAQPQVVQTKEHRDWERWYERHIGPYNAPSPQAAGGGGSGGGQQSQQNQPTGQKAVASAGKDSNDFHELAAAAHVLSSGKKIRMSKSKEDDDVLHEVDCSGEKDYCGGTPAKHKFSKVLTLAGPAKNVYGRLPD
jgi:hypothetical protein